MRVVLASGSSPVGWHVDFIITLYWLYPSLEVVKFMFVKNIYTKCNLMQFQDDRIRNVVKYQFEYDYQIRCETPLNYNLIWFEAVSSPCSIYRIYFPVTLIMFYLGVSFICWWSCVFQWFNLLDVNMLVVTIQTSSPDYITINNQACVISFLPVLLPESLITV